MGVTVSAWGVLGITTGCPPSSPIFSSFVGSLFVGSLFFPHFKVESSMLPATQTRFGGGATLEVTMLEDGRLTATLDIKGHEVTLVVVTEDDDKEATVVNGMVLLAMWLVVMRGEVVMAVD